MDCPFALANKIGEAESGDDAAERELCAQAARRLMTGQPMPPQLLSWLAGGLVRRAQGGTWIRAFAPKGRQDPETTLARKEMQDASIVHWVDRAIDIDKLATSKDGEPGPAFDAVAKSIGITPGAVRDRYYRAKKRKRTKPDS